MYVSSLLGRATSLGKRKSEATPVTRVRMPKTRKKVNQPAPLAIPEKPPKMMSIEIRGKIAKTDSIFPLVCGVEISVAKALKAASLAVLPKKVIRQSRIMIKTPASIAAFATGNKAAILSVVIKANDKTERPQAI